METQPDAQETWQSSCLGDEQLACDFTQIPFDSLRRLGTIFSEGDKKHGGNRHYSANGRTIKLRNWHLGVVNKKYQLDRANHALKHLLIYIHWLETGEYLGEQQSGGDRKLINVPTDVSPDGLMAIETEDDIAKVMWFCATQMELERKQTL